MVTCLPFSNEATLEIAPSDLMTDIWYDLLCLDFAGDLGKDNCSMSFSGLSLTCLSKGWMEGFWV